MEGIIIDTSAIYAMIDKSDNFHEPAKEMFFKLSKDNLQVIITNFIVAECHCLITARIGHELARKWLQTLLWPIERILEEDEKKAREIILTYTDKSFSYTDATTFAVMERLGITKALAFDQHFQQYGLSQYGVSLS